MSNSIFSHSQDDDIREIINKLIDYINIHFSTEEALLDILSSKEKKSHVEKHLEFKNKVLIIKEKIENQRNDIGSFSIEILNDLYIFVSQWLVGHIIRTDKEIFKLIESKK